MPPSILALPHLTFPMQVGNNEDWLDAWPYLDANAAPIPLIGLTLNFMVRSATSSARLAVIASTALVVLGFPINGWVVVGGAGSNVVALTVPRETMIAVPAGAYNFELQAVGDGITRTIASGPLTVVQGVVR